MLDTSRALLAASWAIASFSSLGAQSLVADIETSVFRTTDHPTELTVSGSTLFFAGSDAHGSELWSSDGVVGAETVARDIRPGGASSLPLSVTDLDGAGRVVFTAYVPATGREVWVSDGTSTGTFLLADVLPGPESSRPSGLFRFGSRVFFASDDGQHGRELWSTDGTIAGTSRVIDLAPGVDSGMDDAEAFGVSLGSVVLFAGDDGGATSTDLWITDGTANGTSPVADFGPSTPVRIVPSDNPLRAWLIVDAPAGQQIWSSDGTASGTSQIVDVGALTGDPVETETDRQGDLYFTSGGRLFRTEFATATTTELPVSSGLPVNPVGVGPYVLFAAGGSLWRTDGTVPGTVPVGSSVNPGLLSDRVVVGGEVFFLGSGSISNVLWASDGTAAGTRQVAVECATCFVPRKFVEWNGQVAFTARGGTQAFREVWCTDGTAAGTHVVTSVDNSIGNSSFPEHFVTVGDRAYFVTNNGPVGSEIYTTDGTEAGTYVLDDIRSGPEGSAISDLFVWNDGLYFFANGDEGSGLFRAPTVPPGGGATAPAERLTTAWVWSDFAVFQDRLWFGGGQNGAGEVELWSTDGTVAGTARAIDVIPGPFASFPAELEVVGDKLFFSARDPLLNEELWVTDGTAAGTSLVLDIWPGPLRGGPEDMHALNGGLLFTAQTPTTGRDLWWSDGTAAGTVMLADFEQGLLGSTIEEIYIDGDRAYFRAADASGGLELWETDGTVAGTRQVVDLVPGPEDSRPEVLGRVGAELLFTGWDPAIGHELWATDGTSVRLVADITPGPDGSAPGDGFVVGAGNRMLFSASGPDDFGAELWVTDGTEAGTRRVEDIYVGGQGSYPADFARAGDQVFFRASSRAYGWEPWVLDTNVIDAALADAYGTGCPGHGGLIPNLVPLAAPVLGGVDVLELRDAAPFAPAVAAMGLRADLPIGFGCTLLVDPIVSQIQTTTDATGVAPIAFAIPDVPVLLHFEFSVQPLVLDPAGAWLGIASLGEGLTLRLGE